MFCAFQGSTCSTWSPPTIRNVSLKKNKKWSFSFFLWFISSISLFNLQYYTKIVYFNIFLFVLNLNFNNKFLGSILVEISFTWYSRQNFSRNMRFKNKHNTIKVFWIQLDHLETVYLNFHKLSKTIYKH